MSSYLYLFMLLSLIYLSLDSRKGWEVSWVIESFDDKLCVLIKSNFPNGLGFDPIGTTPH
jgi:hypothetical protein